MIDESDTCMIIGWVLLAPHMHPGVAGVLGIIAFIASIALAIVFRKERRSKDQP